MHTGDAYLDAKYIYFPAVLTHEELFAAVKTRFPKLPNLNEMNKTRLFEFYKEHILPRPQRNDPITAKGLVRRALPNHGMDGEEEELPRLCPLDIPDFRLKKLGVHFWNEDKVEEELENKIRLKADQIAKSRLNDGMEVGKVAEDRKSHEDPGPSTSGLLVLKRSHWDKDKCDSEPPIKKRSEITWP